MLLAGVTVGVVCGELCRHHCTMITNQKSKTFAEQSPDVDWPEMLKTLTSSHRQQRQHDNFVVLACVQCCVLRPRFSCHTHTHSGSRFV